MKPLFPRASIRRICRVLAIPRSTFYPATSVSLTKASREADDALILRIHALIQQHPTFGYRRIWALLRFGDKLVINRKRVYRIMRHKRWMVSQRSVTPKPRVKKRKSVAAAQTNAGRWM